MELDSAEDGCCKGWKVDPCSTETNKRYELNFPVQMFTSMASLPENGSVEMELVTQKNDSEKNGLHLRCCRDSTQMNMCFTISEDASLFTQAMDKVWRCKIVNLEKVNYVDTPNVASTLDCASSALEPQPNPDNVHFSQEMLSSLRSQGSFRCFLCGFLVKRRNRPYFKSHLLHKHGLKIEKYKHALSLDDYNAIKELRKLQKGTGNLDPEGKANISPVEVDNVVTGITPRSSTQIWGVAKMSNEHEQLALPSKGSDVDISSSPLASELCTDTLGTKVVHAEQSMISYESKARDVDEANCADKRNVHTDMSVESNIKLITEATNLIDSPKNKNESENLLKNGDLTDTELQISDYDSNGDLLPRENDESTVPLNDAHNEQESDQLIEANNKRENYDVKDNDVSEHSSNPEANKKEKLFQCFSCLSSFYNLSKLIYHYNNSHREEEDFMANLLELESTRNSMKKFPYKDIVTECPYCKVTRIGWSIISHLRLFHKGEEGFEEVVQELDQNIDSQYKIKRSLKSKLQLMEEKKSGKVWRCNFCQKQFNHRSSMSRHRSFCSDNPDSANKARKHRCSVCQKRFDSIEEMHTHQAQHDSINFVCDVCGKAYKNMSGVTVHKRREHKLVVKNPIKYHECEICGKTFYQKSQWKFHVQSHSDKKEYACDLCDKVFKQQKDLTRHKDRIHFNKYPYQCSLCGHGVDKKKYLLKHVCGRVKRTQGNQFKLSAETSPKESSNTNICPPIASQELISPATEMDMFYIIGESDKGISDATDMALSKDPEPTMEQLDNATNTTNVTVPMSMMPSIFDSSTSDPDRFLHNPGMVQVRGTNHSLMEAVPVYAVMDMQENTTNPILSVASGFSDANMLQPSVFQLPPLQMSTLQGFVSTVGALSPNTDPQMVIQNQSLGSMFPTLEGMILPPTSQDSPGFY